MINRRCYSYLWQLSMITTLLFNPTICTRRPSVELLSSKTDRSSFQMNQSDSQNIDPNSSHSNKKSFLIEQLEDDLEENQSSTDPFETIMTKNQSQPKSVQRSLSQIDQIWTRQLSDSQNIDPTPFHKMSDSQNVNFVSSDENAKSSSVDVFQDDFENNHPWTNRFESIVRHNSGEVRLSSIPHQEPKNASDSIQDELEGYQNDDRIRVNDEIILSKNLTVSKLSNRIRAIIEHYQQEDPVGIPDTDIPDPLPVPDLQQGSMQFEHMAIHGLAKFKIVNVQLDASAMEFRMDISLAKLEILGNYTLNSWLSSSKGPFNVSLVNVNIAGNAVLVVNSDGKLQGDRVNTDGRVADIELDFKNLNMLGSMVQGVLNTAGTFLFDTIKPQILQEFNVKLLQTMNENLKSFNHTFPRREAPVDSLIRTIREHVRNQRLDPYAVQIDPSLILLNNSVFRMEEIVIHGLSTFYRIGEISVQIQNKSLQLTLHVGFPRVKGRVKWSVTYLTKSQTCFQMKYIELRVSINQAINKIDHQSPQLNDIDIRIGQIKLVKQYSKTSMYRNMFDHYLYNILPNVVRLQILATMKGPLKFYVQKTLDQIKPAEYLTQLS